MKKICISVLFIFAFLLSYCSYASSFNLTATPESINVNPGDEVSVTLKISDIDAGSEGINVVETTLEYDNNYIESVDFIEKNDWKSEYNSNQGNLFGKLLYTKMVTGVTSDEEIGVLKIKIKEHVDEFETQVKLKNVTSNDGYNLIDAGTKIINLKYKIVPPGPQPTPPEDKEPEKEPEVEPEKEPEKQPEQKPVEPAKEETKPAPIIGYIQNAQTGDIIGIVTGILLLAVVLSIVLYIISKHNKNKE